MELLLNSLAEASATEISKKENPQGFGQNADVAALYGVETRRINEAVRNNPDKFPKRYMFELTKSELHDLRSKISTTKVGKMWLTDEWDRAGVKQGQEYATLTDIITREWSGKTTRQYKQLTSFSSFAPRPFKRT